MDIFKDYGMFFQSANCAIYVIRDNKVIDCNPEALKQSEFSQEALFGLDFSELFAAEPSDSEIIRTKLAQKTAAGIAGTPQVFEAVMRRATSPSYDGLINFFCIHADQNILGAMINDITESKKSFCRLEESEELYKILSENSFIAVYLIQGGKFIYANELVTNHMLKKYGNFAFSAENLIGMDSRSFVHEDDQEAVAKAISDITHGKRTVPFEYRIPLANKENISLLGMARLVKYKGKTALLMNAMDITELKQTERRMRDMKRLESSLLAAMPQAVIGLVERRIVFVNKAAENMFGWNEQELIGENSRIIYRNDEEFNQGRQILIETLEAGKKSFAALELPFPLKKKDGSEILCRATGSIIGNYADDQRLVIILEDITEKKLAQMQLQQSEKMASIGQLAAGIAHEINNPTAFVNSNLKTLQDYINDITEVMQLNRSLVDSIRQEDSTKSELINNFLTRIDDLEKRLKIDFIFEDIDCLIKESREGTDRIIRIVRDLKNFAHPGDDKLKSVNINGNLDSTLNIIWNEIKYKAVVHKEYADIPNIYCYPQQLNQVFMNILVNAAQAIKEKGDITITTGIDPDDYLVVKIKDNGPGISQGNLAKIFTPFFTTKDVGKGTGMGLNLSYGIIQKHQGKIEVESQEGVGTTFTIKIPAKYELDQASESEAR